MWYLLFIPAGIMIILVVSPVTVNIRYTLRETKDPDPNAVFNLVSPDTGMRISFLWGLATLRMRMSSAGMDFGALNPVLRLRTRLAGRSGVTVVREKAGITPARAWRLYRRIRKIMRAVFPAYKYLLSKTTLHRFCWQTRLGLYEADQTGLAVGMLWIIKSNVAARIYRLLNKPAPKPDLQVTPVFNVRLLNMYLNLVLSLRLGYLILAIMLGGWLYRKNY